MKVIFIWNWLKNLQDIKFVYHKSEPGLNSLKLTLRDNYRVEFEEANPITKKQENEFFRCFPRSFSNEGFWKIEVLAKDLNDVKLDSSIASYKDPYKAIYRLLKKWSELKSFSHWLCFPIDSKFIEDILRLFPQNWKFNVKIACRYIDDFKEFRSYLDDISKLNIKELIIDFENSNIILDEVIFSLLDLKNLKKNLEKLEFRSLHVEDIKEFITYFDDYDQFVKLNQATFTSSELKFEDIIEIKELMKMYFREFRRYNESLICWEKFH